MSMYGTDYPEAYDPGPENDPAETPSERAKRLFPRLDWDALWADDDEEEWIHDPLLPARRSVVIYSAPKVGKSLLMLEMAVAISRGEAFLDYTGRQVRVLYVDFENDPRGDVRSRLQAMGYVPADLEGLDYLSFPSMAGLDTERGALELLEAVKAYGSEVVIVDTVSPCRRRQGERERHLPGDVPAHRPGTQACRRCDHPARPLRQGRDQRPAGSLSQVRRRRCRLEADPCHRGPFPARLHRHPVLTDNQVPDASPARHAEAASQCHRVRRGQ